jgi:hypothetical protein
VPSRVIVSLPTDLCTLPFARIIPSNVQINEPENDDVG